MNTSILCVIPARFGSTRLPGKPLIEVSGLPLVMWAYRSAQNAGVFDRILVATDDKRIFDMVLKHGGEAVMTSKNHVRGTDRVWEAVQGFEAGFVVNIQGDEPELPSLVLSDFVRSCKELDDTTLLTVAAHATISEIENPNVVKVVLDARDHALYFSRSRIPFDRVRAGESPGFLAHKGIYGFTREGLRHYCALPQGVLEQRESLEQLRALEYGMHIRCLVRDFASGGIDTPEDLTAFRDRHEPADGKTGSYGNREQKNTDRR